MILLIGCMLIISWECNKLDDLLGTLIERKTQNHTQPPQNIPCTHAYFHRFFHSNKMYNWNSLYHSMSPANILCAWICAFRLVSLLFAYTTHSVLHALLASWNSVQRKKLFENKFIMKNNGWQARSFNGQQTTIK